jgi:hypothetical protein
MYPHPMAVKYSHNMSISWIFGKMRVFWSENKDDPFVENRFWELRDGRRDAFFRFIVFST